MITNLDPSSELFLANVNRIQQALADTNRQITSGKKIGQPSDAPDQIAPLLQLRAALQHNTQVQSNLVLAGSDADAADGALSSAIQLMDRAMTLGSQGSDPVQSSDTRASLAQEVQSIQEQMVTISQTAVQGRFIFSGDDVNNPPYTFDPTLLDTNPVVAQSTSQATCQVEDPAGGSFAASRTAQGIFDDQANGAPAPDNVFNALNTLRLALIAGDPQAITDSISSIKQASTRLNSVQSFYGMVQSRIQDANTWADQHNTQLQTQISQIEDADPTAAALQLTQLSTQLQAAFQMQARMPHDSLFNYLA